MDSETRCWLSTSDNPHNPLASDEELEKWSKFDQEMDYGTMNLWMRVAKTSPEFSDPMNEDECELACDSIVGWNIPFINKYNKEVRYIKVVRS